MLDIKFIRENPDKVKQAMKNRGWDDSELSIVDDVLQIDKERRRIQQELDSLKAEKNKASKQIGAGGNKEKIIEEMRKIDARCDELEQKMKHLSDKFIYLLYKIPNIPTDDTPVGKDDTENVEIRKWGEIPHFGFEVKDHLDLGRSLDIIDNETSSKVAGTRFTYLKGPAALIQFALVQWVMGVLTSEEKVAEIVEKAGLDVSVKPFVPVVPPVMIRPDVYVRMARLSDEDKDERYYLEKDDLYLVGSAEHTLGPMYMDTILSEDELPLRFVGFSTCFRREAGSYGKDTRGILRVHQFDKIEMESFTLPEDGIKEQEFLVAVQEYLTQQLKIPYRVVHVCTGDMGGPDARQIDLEMWMPGQNKYRETHSADYMADYQSRRLMTRVRRKSGGVEYVHMNDATAFAIGRTLIAILENYQQEDGTIKIPKVLVPYLGFEIIK